MILVLPLTKLDQKLGEKPHSFGVRLRFCQDDRKNRYFCNVCQVLTEGCRSVLKFHTRSSCYFSFHTVSYVSDNVYVVILQKKMDIWVRQKNFWGHSKSYVGGLLSEGGTTCKVCCTYQQQRQMKIRW